MTYPGLQDLHSTLKRLAHSFNAPSISFQSGATSMDKRARHQLRAASFNAVARVVETLVAGNDPQYQLSAESRVTLRTAISAAPQYVAFILPLFYDPGTLEQICGARKGIDEAYSDHGDALKHSTQFPNFRRLWQEIRTEKRLFRHIIKIIRSDKPWMRAVIHRLAENNCGESARGRRVVLDPTNPDEYADETEFYQMSSESAHVVGRRGSDKVELHLLVSATLCDVSDDEIRKILGDSTGQSFSSQKWFLGAHVVNLDRIVPWATWGDLVSKDMLSTVTACRLIHRSKRREADAVRKADGARMVELCFHCDQQGYLRSPRNFRLRLDESSKFDFMRSHDHVMDGVAAVSAACATL